MLPNAAPGGFGVGGGGDTPNPPRPAAPIFLGNILCVILLPTFWIGTNHSFHPMDGIF